VPVPTISLAGYTNAGKSTLFNRLTSAAVLADAKMFATLDPTVRHVTLPSRRRVLLSDTVGFIRNLPTTLVKAFRATLEEVTEAALLLHVVDASSQHAAQQTGHVLKVLAEIGAENTKQILVMNKIDLIGDTPDGAHNLAQRILGEVRAPENSQAIAASARTGAGVPEVLELIDRLLPLDPIVHVRLRIPAAEGSAIHRLYEHGRVLAKRYRGDVCELEAEIPESLRKRFSAYVAD
jgi:GTP-binding protein HflX